MSKKLDNAVAIDTIQASMDDQKLMFFMDERFETMCQACIGDLATGNKVMQQAFQLLQDFQDDSPDDAMSPLNCMLMAFYLLASSIPDLDGDNLQRFMLDRHQMMYPCAQGITEQFRAQQNRMGEGKHIVN